MTERAPEQSVTQALSASRILGSGPVSGLLRVAEWQDKMLGEFRLLRRIGGGGMAEVWLAEQTSLKRQVAVKVMRPDIQADETCRKRFEQEALAAAGLNHPNIVQVYAIGESDGIRYIAQEYVAGLNMRDYIAKNGPPPVHVAVHLMKQVASALQAAAEAGIVHRDVKPENILLTRKGLAKVVDFGLAQLTQAGDLRLTQQGMTMGTPLYMSPEQVQGQKVDQRSDIYSLGITFYHLLCGRPPFRGETVFAVAYHQVHTEPPPLSESRPDLPRSLCEVVHRMMAKQPDERFQTAQELLQELRNLDPRGMQDVNGPTAGGLPTPAESGLAVRERLRRATKWLSPVAHPRASFVLWAVLVGAVSAAAGTRSNVGSALKQPVIHLAHVAKQPTVAEQLNLARRENTEDAWWAVLALFPGDAPEKHDARQALIPRLLRQLRLSEAERLCREVLEFRDAPGQAQATAWAGLALVAGLRGNLAEAQRLRDQQVRPLEQFLSIDLRDWLAEVLERRPQPPGGPPGISGRPPMNPDRRAPRANGRPL